jgi:spermidine synthase
LLLHPAPKQIFLVGNGFSGAVEEILKYHSVEKVDYAEIDVKLLNSAQKTFPPQATEFMNDHRVRLIEEDGRKWIKRTKNEYDCIIIGLPDPSTGQLNRYFTREFFQEAKRALKSGGVFAFSLTASEDYIEPELAESLAGFARTLKQIFPQVVILPGEREQFLAGERLLCAESDSIIYRIKERGIENYYVSPYFLPFRLSVEKCQYLSKNLNVAKSRWLNRDFQPQGYIRTLARWERQFHPQWGKFYEELWSISGYQLLVAILVLTVLIAILFKGSMFEKGVMIGVGGAGMAQMGMQLMLILGFQSIFGYMFYQQAILIAGFMVGAALGSFEGRRWVVKVESKRRRGLLQLQGGMMLLPFFIFSLLWLAKDYGGVTKHLLSLGAIICGWMGGLQFALGASCLFGEGHKRGGGLYAVDLAGSALGALIAGVLLTPLLGFWWTAIILSAISLMPLILLIWGVNH